MVEQENSLGTSLRKKAIDVFEKHNLLIDDYIRNLSIGNVDYGIQIERLVVPCRFFEATIKDVRQNLGQEDFKCLSSSLSRLAQLFDAKEV
ncbi:hypothetical protein CNMCM6106_003898 [Aspergillus hiratsukae]|uniref:Uncharacterized protein n=1 Tax=Aspergillus hiratsukae TaxID=1194566 RepID=A0A8H6UVS9_9EURO|nr:hypothetical protein CNMCM6106_003898 [Aspergillus hiratsukae]